MKQSDEHMNADVTTNAAHEHAARSPTVLIGMSLVARRIYRELLDALQERGAGERIE
jgi:hypothetical protein